MEHLTGAKVSSLSRIRLMRVSVKRVVGLGSGQGSGSILVIFYLFFFQRMLF